MFAGRKTAGIAGLLYASGVWGLMWWPYRWLAAQGIGGEQAQLANYLVALVLGGGVLFGLMRRPWRLSWEVWVMGLSAGWANVGYVFAVINGEVMRITLLFYMAPVWTLILAYLMLGERPNRYGLLVFLLSFAGAIAMLWQPALGLPWPRNGYEWVAVSGGVCFALNNVLSRRASEIDPAVKSFAVWVGCSVVSLGALLLFQSNLTALAAADSRSWLLLVGMGLALVVASVGVQTGLKYVGASQAVVIMLFELVVAALSAYVIAGEALSVREWLGGLMIVGGSLFSGQLAHTEEEHA